MTRGIALTRSLLTRSWLEMAGAKAAYTTASPLHMQREVPLTIQNLNPCVKEMEYAVRGAVPLEALRIANELKQVFTGASGIVYIRASLCKLLMTLLHVQN